MFCKQCGTQMLENSQFCGKCGGGQNGQVGGYQQQQVYKPPNYEMRTVQCYPSDEAEREEVDFYAMCGWEVMGMDRKQTFEGTFSDGTGGQSKRYLTRSHIQIKRDRNMPNFIKIKELSDKADSFRNKSDVPKPQNYGEEDTLRTYRRNFALVTVLTLGMLLVFTLPLVLYFSSKLKKLERETILYHKSKSKNNEIALKYAKQCDALIRGS